MGVEPTQDSASCPATVLKFGCPPADRCRLVADKRIIGGHQRLVAARRLGHADA